MIPDPPTRGLRNIDTTAATEKSRPTWVWVVPAERDQASGRTALI
jgi:hypothetical protein